MKACSECGLIKPLTAYYKGKLYKDNYRNQCKKCISNYGKAKYNQTINENKLIMNGHKNCNTNIVYDNGKKLDFSKNPKLESIIKIVCNYYAVSYENFCKNYKRNWRELVQIRQFVMWLYRNNTGYSLTVIGSFFNKDHSTVLFSVKVVDQNRKAATKIKKDTDNLIRLIQAEFPEFNEPKLPPLVDELPKEKTFTQKEVIKLIIHELGSVAAIRLLRGCNGDLSNYLKPAE